MLPIGTRRFFRAFDQLVIKCPLDPSCDSGVIFGSGFGTTYERDYVLNDDSEREAKGLLQFLFYSALITGPDVSIRSGEIAFKGSQDDFEVRIRRAVDVTLAAVPHQSLMDLTMALQRNELTDSGLLPGHEHSVLKLSGSSGFDS